MYQIVLVQLLHNTFCADKFESASRHKKVNSLNKKKKILSTLYFAFRDDVDSFRFLLLVVIQIMNQQDLSLHM